MQRRQFRIGELAKTLGIGRSVVRFWEREFGFAPQRSFGGQRCYGEKDLEKLRLIKDLLYVQGLTIAGAKKLLKEKHHDLHLIASTRTSLDEHPAYQAASHHDHIIDQLKILRTHLETLHKLL